MISKLDVLKNKLIAKLGDDNWRVLRGILIVSGFVILGKFAAVAKEMTLAYRFGVGRTIDIYVFAFVLISWVPAVFQSVVQSIVVPLFNRLAPPDRESFFSELVTGAAAFGGLLIVIVFMLPEEVYWWLASGFTPDMKREVVATLRLLSPCVLLLALIAVFSSEMLSREKHANTLFEAIPALVMCLFVVFWQARNQPILPLILGTLTGLVIQLVALMYSRYKQTGMFVPVLYLRHPAWRQLAGAIGILLVGTLIMSLVKIIDQYFAASLGEGNVSKLSYALRVLTLGVALGNTVLSRAILPVLSENGKSRQSRLNLAWQWSHYTFLLSFIISVVAWYLAPWAVALLFERGAFMAQDTKAVASIVQFGILQVPFVMTSMIFVQLFAALGEYRKIAFSSVIAIVVKLICAPIAVSWLGLEGLLLSTSLMYAANFIYFAILVQLWRRNADQPTTV